MKQESPFITAAVVMVRRSSSARWSTKAVYAVKALEVACRRGMQWDAFDALAAAYP